MTVRSSAGRVPTELSRRTTGLIEEAVSKITSAAISDLSSPIARTHWHTPPAHSGIRFRQPTLLRFHEETIIILSK